MLSNQKEIGAILIEMNNRNVDRFFSLIEFSIVVFALYAAVAAYNLSNVITSLQTIDWSLIFCISSILISIYYSTLQIQFSGKSITLLKKENESIQFKSEQELIEQNYYLFSSINTQYDTFISSLLLIICSLGFSLSFLIPKENSLKVALFYIILVLFIISNAYKFRRKIKALCTRQEIKLAS